MKRRIVLLGPPAAGKGTQAELMQARCQLPSASPGAILREESRRGTALGRKAESYTSQGRLVPAEIANVVMKEWLDRNLESFVFDGYPRSLEQAQALDQMLEERQSSLDVVLSLEIDLATITDRVTNRLMCKACGRILNLRMHGVTLSSPCPACGGTLAKRHDDTPTTLQERMAEYATKTEPLIHFYKERNLLRSVDARPEPEAVFAQITDILGAL